MKHFITCPRCAQDGKNRVLCEVLTDDTIAIARQRSKWSYEESTLIHGTNFELICGYCRTVCYVRKEENESSNFGIAWFSWVSYKAGSIIQGIGSSINPTGTSLLTEGSQGIL